MKIIDRYIFRELVGPFLFGVAVFSIILVAGFILPQLTNLYTQAGLNFQEGVLLFIYSLPRYLIHTLAMSALLAVLMAFGRLSAESELVALHAAGASLPRLALPGLAFGVAVSLLALGIGEKIVPSANFASDNLLEKVRAHHVGVEKDVLFKEGSRKQRRTISAASLDASTGTMKRVTIIQFKNAEPEEIIYAESAQRDEKSGVWHLYNGYTKPLRSGLPVAAVNFQEQIITNLASAEEIAALSKRGDEMTSQELRDQIAVLARSGESAAMFAMELCRRFAIPFAALVFTLIGTPLGMRSHRRSSSLGVGLTILIVFAYFVMINWLSIIAENGGLAPLVAAWMPNAVFAAVGLVFIFTARK